MTLRESKGTLRVQYSSKNASRANRFISLCGGVFFFFIICLMVFFQDKLSFAYSQPYLAKNIILFAISIAFIFIVVLISKQIRWIPKPYVWRAFLAVYFSFLLMAQILFVRSVWYWPGFDVANVYSKAQQIAQGSEFDKSYFRGCPNNAPITILQSILLWIAIKVGLPVPYAVLPYAGALISNISLLLSVLCAEKITHSKMAGIWALLLGTTWTAFSMLITIPYTDIFALLFPVLALYIFLSNIHLYAKWFLISLVSFFGASIKPTVIIFLVALLMLRGIHALKTGKWTWKKIGRIALLGAMVALGALPGTVWQTQSTVFMAGTATPQEQLSETHYLMMGMNGDTYGGYAQADVLFSQAYTDLADRRAANIQRAWERLSSRSIVENVDFFTIKAYKAFSDGMLAANKSFLVVEIPNRADRLSDFLRRVVYTRGNLHSLYVTVEQGIWIGILLLCMLATVLKRGDQSITALLSLTLLGLAAYQLLFEVWPRYIYLYSPLFIILASLGLDKLRMSKAQHDENKDARPNQLLGI